MGIGDEVMVSGMVREAQARDKRRVLIQYEKNKHRWSDLWTNNPRIAQPQQNGDFQILRPRENYLRPYCSAKTAEQWTWREYRPPRGEIYLWRAEREHADRHAALIVLEPNVKYGASPNKAWRNDWWTIIAHGLREHNPVQVGATTPRFLAPGVRFVQTTIRQAAGIVSRARLLITVEGALHHIAAVFRTPTIVIRGGFISERVTGYDGQISLFRGDDLGCGMRVPCEHCESAMNSISPEEVLEHARRILGVVR